MNSKSTLRQALLLAVIVTIDWAGVAAAPSGSFRYELAANSGVSLYNFSGSYSAPFLSSNAVVVLYQNAKGELSGSEGPFPVENPNVELTGAVSGSVRNTGTNLAVRLEGVVWISLRPIGDDYLDEIGIQRKDRMSLVMVSGAGTMSGTDKTTATTEKITYTSALFGLHRHVTKLSTDSYERPISLALLPKNDGSWALDLNMVPNANKLSGTAAITFPNNKQFQFDLAGSYLPETGKTKVLLKGTGEDKGANLMVLLAGADMSIESMRGNVGGQRVRAP
jgi:hypothetical protein